MQLQRLASASGPLCCSYSGSLLGKLYLAPQGHFDYLRAAKLNAAPCISCNTSGQISAVYADAAVLAAHAEEQLCSSSSWPSLTATAAPATARPLQGSWLQRHSALPMAAPAAEAATSVTAGPSTGATTAATKQTESPATRASAPITSNATMQRLASALGPLCRSFSGAIGSKLYILLAGQFDELQAVHPEDAYAAVMALLLVAAVLLL